MTLVSPPTLLPLDLAGWTVEVRYDLDEAISEGNPDVVMMLRIQAERMKVANTFITKSPIVSGQAKPFDSSTADQNLRMGSAQMIKFSD